jgi:hypothetical protein
VHADASNIAMTIKMKSRINSLAINEKALDPIRLEGG